MADSEEKKPKKTRKRQRIEETIRASDPWEPVGQTPMPDITDLRNWDMRLMKTYQPWYAPFCDVCCFCTYGKCDLTAGRRGGCGIDIAGQQGRIVLLAAAWGCPPTVLTPGMSSTTSSSTTARISRSTSAATWPWRLPTSGWCWA